MTTPRNIDLHEGRRSGPYALSKDQRDALRQIKSIAIERADISDFEPLYHLTPSSEVGAVEVDGLSVRIEPKVGVPQLLSLACYANRINMPTHEFGFHEDAALPDFLALALVSAAQRAFSQGLLHGYLTQEEVMYAVRGRIRIEEQIRHGFGSPIPVAVRYDEFTDDITANQLVKAAVYLLGMMRLRPSNVHQGLVRIAAMLDRVSLVEFPAGDVPRVEFNRLNGHYREVIALSRMVLQHRAYQLERGPVRAFGLLMDMPKLFQDFVTVALREELAVSEEQFGEMGIDTLDVPSTGLRGRISLRPDLVWREGSRYVFVGDAKYKSVDEESVRNADLYQMLAYVTALNLAGGLLIYAKGAEEAAQYRVRHSGKLLEVVSLDLSGTFECILQRVRGLAKTVYRLRNLRAASRPSIL